jgi:hypothetical protein
MSYNCQSLLHAEPYLPFNNITMASTYDLWSDNVVLPPNIPQEADSHKMAPSTVQTAEDNDKASIHDGENIH